MPDAERLLTLAEAVADGQTPDWAAAESNAAEPAERLVIRKLRAVQTLGGLLTARTTPRPLPPWIPLLEPGQTWGLLDIRECVGRGRFGEVYRAWDPALDREVALKLLRSSASDATGDAGVVSEGRLMARVRHPNVAAIYGAQRVGETTGLWMEFVEGRTLASELAERGPFALAELLRVGVDLCGALAAVHGAGLVHRDVKAQNVMRDRSGRIVLGDFGTGRALDEPDSARTGLAGTPAYLAPEVFSGQPATPQSDIYALGALLFYLATGRHPVEGGSYRELREAHAAGQRLALQHLRPDLPEHFVTVVNRALAAAPPERFGDAAAMARALVGRDARGGIRSRAAVAAVGGTALVLLTMVALATWSGAGGPRSSLASFSADDYVLIATFENATGNPLLDGTLEYALERELSNSTFVNVVPRGRVEDTLSLMRRPPDTRLDAAIAHEVAKRDGGIRAIVAGRIEKVGSHYMVSTAIVSPEDGSNVGSVSRGPVSEAELVTAVTGLAIDLRARMGEALPAIQEARASLEKVSTISLRALQLFSQARALAGEGTVFGQPQTVERLLREALREDPDFLWAHLLLGHALWAQGRNVEMMPHFERAASLGASANTVDRLVATAELDAMRALGTPDALERIRLYDRALAAYQAVLQLQPDHWWAFGCVVNISARIGRVPEPAQARRLVELRPHSLIALYFAHRSAVLNGNLELAGEYARRASVVPIRGSAGADLGQLRLFPAYLAWLRNDVQQALSITEQVDRDMQHAELPTRARSGLAIHVALAYLGVGALDRAEQAVSRIETDIRRHTGIHVAVARGDRVALREYLRRNYPRLEDSVAISSVVIEAGLTDLVRRGLKVLDSRGPGPFPILVRAQLELAAGRPAEAIHLFEQYFAIQPEGASRMNIRASRKLAEAHAARGDLVQAILTLEKASAWRESRLQVVQPDLYAWLLMREELAVYYRRARRIADAEGVEAELRTLLAVADEDHPIKRRLQQPR